MPALSLNNQNLPYPDPIHPIIVHFVIAMVFFSFYCDVVGYLTGNHRLFEVSWWNMFVGAITYGRLRQRYFDRGHLWSGRSRTSPTLRRSQTSTGFAYHHWLVIVSDCCGDCLRHWRSQSHLGVL